MTDSTLDHNTLDKITKFIQDLIRCKNLLLHYDRIKNIDELSRQTQILEKMMLYYNKLNNKEDEESSSDKSSDDADDEKSDNSTSENESDKDDDELTDLDRTESVYEISDCDEEIQETLDENIEIINIEFNRLRYVRKFNNVKLNLVINDDNKYEIFSSDTDD